MLTPPISAEPDTLIQDNGTFIQVPGITAMAQDFAKQRPPQQQAARKPAKGKASSSSRWSWFFSGVFVGVALVAGGYFGFLQYQSLQPVTTEGASGSQASPELPAFEFDFYRELATADVPINVPDDGSAAPTAATATPAPQSAPATTAAAAEPVINFLLQAGSFQNRQEADERRAKITLMNMSAEIVPGVVAGRTWYRVQVGPFAGRPAAEEARKQLSANNIDSLPLLMR